MILYPSIDLRNGGMVCYVRGAADAVDVETADPLLQATQLAESGFRWLHLVDLNGATRGTQSANSDAIKAILSTVNINVQLGGGIRNMDTIEYWLEQGAERVVVGTMAVKNPVLVQEACKKFPGRIAVSIDARGGRVSLSGWTEDTDIRALDLALRYEDARAAAVIYTDIGSGGNVSGINIEAISDLAFALTTPLIASGGIASLEDISLLQQHETSGIVGAICGPSLQSGQLDPQKAIAIAGEQVP